MPRRADIAASLPIVFGLDRLQAAKLPNDFNTNNARWRPRLYRHSHGTSKAWRWNCNPICSQDFRGFWRVL